MKNGTFTLIWFSWKSIEYNNGTLIGVPQLKQEGYLCYKWTRSEKYFNSENFHETGLILAF